MQLASIVPQNYLVLTEEATFHLALAQFIQEEGFDTYTNFFKNVAKGYVIMDNGVFEGTKNLSIAELVAKAEYIEADELVLPDVYKNSKETLLAHQYAVNYIAERYSGVEHAPFRLMGVPQGTNKKEWLACAVSMLQMLPITTIGIPKHLNETFGERDGRLLVISDLAELVDLGGIDIHLLGCAKTPLEVTMISKASYDGTIPTVRSCDSAMAYVYARNGLHFSDSDRPENDPIDFKLGHCNGILLAYNIAAWNNIGDMSPENKINMM